MSRPASTGPAQQPLQLSGLERPAFAHLFSLADTSKSGLITGDQAVEFFSKANPPLPPASLGLIWSLADTNNNGFLTPPSFSIALRLIAHAQRGEPANEAAIHKPGAPPNFNGVTLPPSETTSSSNSNSNSAFAATNNPNYIPISPSDRSRYMRIFANSNPQRGLIDGDKAKEIFVKSKLPFDKLGAIWNLADTHARGSLDATDFILGMHFIQHTMSGRLNSIPAALPPGLYEQASNGTPISNVNPNVPGSPISNPVVAQSTGGSLGGGILPGGISRQMTGSNVPIPRQLTGQQQSGIQRQLTGQQQQQQGFTSGFMSPSQSNSNFSQAQTQPQPQFTRGNWLVTSADQTKSDRFFDGLDTEKTGALEGQTVVPFFMQSGLGEQVLAHIWDLSDITQSGSLSREEFAVAMYLINGKLAGQEPPQELPENLVPPSLRGKNLPEAVNPQESDTQRDLFSLMDDDPAPPPISTASAFINPAAQSSPAPTPVASRLTRQAPATTSGPFDDDFFGSPAAAPSAVPPRSAIASTSAMTPNLTGARSPPPPTTSKVSFVDDASAELGNKQLQLDQTTKSITSLQSQRQELSTGVSNGASSLAEIESRLSQARITHESESKLVEDLKERHRIQSESLKISREELIRAESDLSALKAEKDEVEQAVMRDREDVRDLQRRMTSVQTETSELKIELEKLKKEARQKKGMVAIGKKQLASAEGEKEKIVQDIKSVENGEFETEEAQPSQFLSNNEALTSTTSPKSPTEALSPSSVRSLNPFDRVGNAVAGERSQSPSTSLSAVGVGAAAGAALGLGGAAVAHEASSSHPEADNVQQENTHQVTSSSGFDDAFGVPSHTTKEASTSSSTAPAFDDDFGSGFDSGAPPTAKKDINVAGGNSTAFDDAFADFGESHPNDGNANVTNSQLPPEQQPPVSDGFEESFAPVEAPTATSIPTEPVQPLTSDPISTTEPQTAPLSETQDQAIPSAESSAPQVEEEEDDEDDVPLSETSAAKRKSRALELSDLSQASTPAQQDNAGDESSDDEEDEPEDLDSHPSRIRGISNATATPGNIGSEVEREVDPISSTEQTLTPAETTNQASDRFPEIPTTVEDEPTTSMPGSIGIVPPVSITQSDSQPEVPGGFNSSTSTGSMFSSIPVDGRASRRTSDAGDDFHDAFDEAPSSSGDAFPDVNGNVNDSNFIPPATTTAIPAGVIGLGSATGAGSTFSNISQQGSEIGHERFSTAIGGEDDLGSSAANPGSDFSSNTSTTLPALAGTTPASSLAAKTRRAPPPAPVRNPNSLTPTGGSGSAQLSNDPFAPTSSSNDRQIDSIKNQNQDPTNSFDDFDSAFEDLGTTSAITTSSSGINNNNNGFDDAFGGDSDFDFVPSFSNPDTTTSQIGNSNSNGFDDSFGDQNQNQNHQQSNSTGPTNQSNSFGGFDDFDSAFNPDGASSYINNNTNNTLQGNNSNSNSGSGFSFEDAFDPSSTSTSVPAPAPAPSLPARSTTQNNSEISNQTQSHSNTTTTSSRLDNALPDDAGQVKQLCGMGFSRENVIKALEKSNYRTEKALERLLAQA